MLNGTVDRGLSPMLGCPLLPGFFQSSPILFSRTLHTATGWLDPNLGQVRYFLTQEADLLAKIVLPGA
jgi:hypothetical protein